MLRQQQRGCRSRVNPRLTQLPTPEAQASYEVTINARCRLVTEIGHFLLGGRLASITGISSYFSGRSFPNHDRLPTQPNTSWKLLYFTAMADLMMFNGENVEEMISWNIDQQVKSIPLLTAGPRDLRTPSSGVKCTLPENMKVLAADMDSLQATLLRRKHSSAIESSSAKRPRC